MTASARKSDGAVTPKKRVSRTKTPAPRRGKRVVGIVKNTARVRELAGGKIVVLLTDPELRKLIVDSIEKGPEMRALVEKLQASAKRVEQRIDRARAEMALGMEALVREEREREEERAAREHVQSDAPTAEQMEAREWLYKEMLKHGPLPSAAEMDAARNSWK